MSSFKPKLKFLPASPGVYLFKNAKGEILYVGKAKVLKNRVRSYFTQSHDLQPRTRQLVANIFDLEYIICDTETEALMLENNLIKRHLPRYNVMLRDDKNYQFIKIDYSTQIPQIYTTRKISGTSTIRPLPTLPSPGEGEREVETPQVYTAKKNDGPKKLKSCKLQARYFGPYTSGSSVRQTLSLMRYIIPYCANSKIGGRPCFYYHLGKCPGVCAGIVSLEEYVRTLAAVERFLSGDLRRVAEDLKRAMKNAAQKKLFEKAARLRDQYQALEKMLERQKIISPKRESHDSLGIFSAGQLAGATLFQIREGRLLGRENFTLINAKDESSNELLRAFLEKYYTLASDVPNEINLPKKISGLEALTAYVEQKFAKRIKFTAPIRGRKRRLVQLAETNARDFLQTASQNSAKEQSQLTRALFELKDKLHLPQLPFRIECFDISNIQGASPTGSLVVFENGKAKKSDYKKFAIKTIDTPNDVAMMKEMLVRRFKHASTSPLSRPGEGGRRSGEVEPWKLPDLIVIDGGRGQLNVALKILKNSKLKIPVLGLAKRLEEIHLPQLKSPLRLPQNSSALHLLQRVRDEAHRFAITYHRKRRSKQLLET